MEKLSNGTVSAAISPYGAELCSIVRNGTEFMWQADPEYWKRHSPVLFPVVGSVWNGTFRIGGRSFSMGQHGYLRDRQFNLVEKSAASVTFRYEQTEEDMKIYPFDFVLDITYRLEDARVVVIWTVLNRGGETMYYQIGAHPAFNYPFFDRSAAIKGYFSFSRESGNLPPDEVLKYILIKEKGCADVGTEYPVTLEDGLLPIAASLFDNDALIFQNSGLKSVTLLSPAKKPWIRVDFDAPALGLWSPSRKNAPFVCIEPWYGRCDRTGYCGEFKDRDFVNALDAGNTMSYSYSIEPLPDGPSL